MFEETGQSENMSTSASTALISCRFFRLRVLACASPAWAIDCVMEAISVSEGWNTIVEPKSGQSCLLRMVVAGTEKRIVSTSPLTVSV